MCSRPIIDVMACSSEWVQASDAGLTGDEARRTRREVAAVGPVLPGPPEARIHVNSGADEPSKGTNTPEPAIASVSGACRLLSDPVAGGAGRDPAFPQRAVVPGDLELILQDSRAEHLGQGVVWGNGIREARRQAHGRPRTASDLHQATLTATV